ncbi:MAG: class I SAM-dependent methyltransferase [Dehalococcoidia bacterium]|nr:class I SAM-dependent methyltransferase [Dehalococcoidia bacterium]
MIRKDEISIWGGAPVQDNAMLETFIKSSDYSSPSYIKKLKFIFSAICNYARSKNKAVKNLEILECGCGTGGITLPLASLGCHVTAFDVDSSALSVISKRIQEEKLNNVIVIEANGGSFDDGRTYDLVVASEVLEHVVDPEEFVQRIRARVNSGSWLVVTIPNGYGPWQLRRRLSIITCLQRNNRLRRILGKKPYVMGQGHCQFYTRKRFLKMLSAFSFRLKDFGRSDSILAVFATRWGSPFGKLDVQLGDILPWWLASGWYFVFEAE